MGSVTHVEKERKFLAKDGHILARSEICAMSISYGGVTVKNESKYSLAAKVKEK